MWEVLSGWLGVVAAIWVGYQLFRWMCQDFQDNMAARIAAENFVKSGQIDPESSEVDVNRPK